jgi:hypothetical protein
MQLIKTSVLVASALGIAVGFSSCKKITADQLINGLWQVNTVNVDTATTNYLDTHLSHFSTGNNCCAYKLDFEKDNTVVAYYIVNDSFYRYDLGYWEATAYKEVFIQVDDFMDGTFKITQPSLKRRDLTSDDNYISAIGDTVKTVVKMEKI